jgi:uncharacterized lipoprotein YajG
MKLAKILFVLAFVVVLAGCGAKQDDTVVTDTGTVMVVTTGTENTGSATVVVVDNSGTVMTGEVMTGEVMTGTIVTGN